jgi:hypothetical protein
MKDFLIYLPDGDIVHAERPGAHPPLSTEHHRELKGEEQIMGRKVWYHLVDAYRVAEIERRFKELLARGCRHPHIIVNSIADIRPKGQPISKLPPSQST